MELSDRATPRGLYIRCGVTHVIDAAALMVARAGYRADPRGAITLVIDAPIGYALSTLDELNCADAPVLATTFNCCPEYIEDLWECGPRALLAGESVAERLPDVIARVERGERFRLAPGCPTQLTPGERRVLRGAAHGWDNARIARQLDVAPSTVMNALTRVYRKVGVGSRAEALLYYWGVWSLAVSDG